MTTLASKIFRLPKQRFVVLFLFCTITLCLEGKVNAQQPTPANILLQSSTSSPTPTASLEERISKLEQRVQQSKGESKDIWDQLDSLDAVATFISGILTLISGILIAWIGYLATNAYKEREIKVSQVQTTTSLMPQLQSRYLEDVELAITLIMALGQVKLAMDLLERYETGVAIPIFLKFLSIPNLEAAEQVDSDPVEKSLQRYLEKLKLIEARNKLLELAIEYQETYIDTSYTVERTAKLEVIISKMRSYALVAFPLLPELLSLIKTIRGSLPVCRKRPEDKDKNLIDKLKGKKCKIQLIQDIKERNFEKPYDDNLNQEIEYMEQKKRERKLNGQQMMDLKGKSVDWLVNGIRLAVVAIVQVQPSFDYLDWLAKLLAKEEGSFLGYHAAVALSNAVDVLKKFHSGELRAAIKLAKGSGRYFYGDDILNKPPFQVLIQAEKKLEESTN